MATKKTNRKQSSKVTVSRSESKRESDQSLMERFQPNLADRQSYLNLILGGLIIVVLGVLVFNYFNKQNGNLGTSQQAENDQQQNTEGDVAKDKLPGNYTVKEGDTLFVIADNYYGDGFLYSKIVEENKLANENAIEPGQVLTIPKLDEQTLAKLNQNNEDTKVEGKESGEITPTAATITPTTEPEGTTEDENNEVAQGGAENQTVWGEKIEANTYTVQPGDWLSKISGRAYGDVMMYQKIAEANNINNPDLIEVGTTLKIPR